MGNNSKTLSDFPSTFERQIHVLSEEERISLQAKYNAIKLREQNRTKLAKSSAKARKASYIVAAICPLHKKPVFVIKEATDLIDAQLQVEGKVVICQYGNHAFTARDTDAALLGKYTMSAGKELKVTNSPFGDKVPIFGTRGVKVSQPSYAKTKLKTDVPTVLEFAERKTVSSKDLSTASVSYLSPKGKVTAVLPRDFAGGEVVKVAVSRRERQIVFIYPHNEVVLFDALFNASKRNFNRASIKEPSSGDIIKHALLAFLVAHGGTTKTQATGFLQANRVAGVTPSTVGEALSRLLGLGFLYHRAATVVYTPVPNFNRGQPKETSVALGPSPVKISSPPKRIGKLEDEQTLGEPFYFMDEFIRANVIRNFKNIPGYKWWLFAEGTSTLRKLHIPLKYEWVRVIKDVSKFKSQSDNLVYGPFTPGTIQKVPYGDAYLLHERGQVTTLSKKLVPPEQHRPQSTSAKSKPKSETVDPRSRRLDLLIKRNNLY